MSLNRKRLQNRILQALYRPTTRKYDFISQGAITFLDELESTLEEKVSPLLSDFF